MTDPAIPAPSGSAPAAGSSGDGAPNRSSAAAGAAGDAGAAGAAAEGEVPLDVAPPLRLVPLAPELPRLRLEPDRRATVGRRITCTLVLPAPEVSRLHAELLARGGRWYVVDQGSRAGTRIEEQPVAAAEPTPLRDGDHLAFGPCAYLVRIGDRPEPAIELADAAPAPGTARVTAAPTGRGLDLLRFASVLRSLAGAADREELHARTALAAVEATGHGRAAIVEATGPEARSLAALVERDAHGVPRRIEADAASRGRPYSRRLVEAALAGEPVVLAGPPSAMLAADLQTVADLAIESAACVPIHVGGRVRACLYLDSRAEDGGGPTASGPIAELLAAACGLALGNIARAELEGRQRRLHYELEAAQQAQRRLLPPAEGVLGPVRWAMRMQPGLVVAGDLFDVVAIDADRTAVVTGDVAGHGIGPGLQMAMTQAVLRTELERTGDPREAIERTHALALRTFERGRFVTLWVGVLERGGRVTYVDAGHGHVRIRRAGDLAPIPDHRRATPVGVAHGAPFDPGTFTLAAGEQLLLWSDGLVEQVGGSGERFGEDGLAGAVASAAGDPAGLVRDVSAALDAFREGAARTDDLTIAAVGLA